MIDLFFFIAARNSSCRKLTVFTGVCPSFCPRLRRAVGYRSRYRSSICTLPPLLDMGPITLPLPGHGDLYHTPLCYWHLVVATESPTVSMRAVCILLECFLVLDNKLLRLIYFFPSRVMGWNLGQTVNTLASCSIDPNFGKKIECAFDMSFSPFFLKCFNVRLNNMCGLKIVWNIPRSCLTWQIQLRDKNVYYSVLKLELHKVTQICTGWWFLIVKPTKT